MQWPVCTPATTSPTFNPVSHAAPFAVTTLSLPAFVPPPVSHATVTSQTLRLTLLHAAIAPFTLIASSRTTDVTFVYQNPSVLRAASPALTSAHFASARTSRSHAKPLLAPPVLITHLRHSPPPGNATTQFALLTPSSPTVPLVASSTPSPPSTTSLASTTTSTSQATPSTTFVTTRPGYAPTSPSKS